VLVKWARRCRQFIGHTTQVQARTRFRITVWRRLLIYVALLNEVPSAQCLWKDINEKSCFSEAALGMRKTGRSKICIWSLVIPGEHSNEDWFAQRGPSLQTVGAVTAHMMSRPHLYTRMLEEASDIGELAVIARDFVHTNATLIRCNLFDHCRDVCKNVWYPRFIGGDLPTLWCGRGRRMNYEGLHHLRAHNRWP